MLLVVKQFPVAAAEVFVRHEMRGCGKHRDEQKSEARRIRARAGIRPIDEISEL